MWYDNLNNKRLWSIFEEISAIPRESGNEEGIRKYLVKWGKDHDIKTIVDKAGNVIMKTSATPGYEDYPSIALQGHMDMVCVKKEGSNHDFRKDGIEIITDGKFIRAKDTSLGGDNGIAIAMILDIFSDPNAEHGPLEGIFTVSEETGLNGAFNIEAENIASRRMLNLDSEEEGVFYIGCAGGIEITGMKTVRLQTAENDDVTLEIKTRGLLGGHSGGEIHKGRANAIKLMGRFLNRLPSFKFVALDGGTRRNVIPSLCTCKINIGKNRVDTVKNLLENLNRELKDEYSLTDPGVEIVLSEAEKAKENLSIVESMDIASLMFLSPTGVRSMSFSLPGIVETSDNMAIICLDKDVVRVVYSVRSSVKSAKYNLAYEIQTLLETFRFQSELEGDYPSWTPNTQSKFTKEVSSAYEKITGVKPVITAIHAGLECGIINEKVEGMDSLSIGPNLYDVHSVNEHIEIESAERSAKFVKEMLKYIK